MKNNGKAMAKAGKKTFLRLIRTIFGFFPVLLPLVLIGILFNAIVGSIPAVFMQKVIAVVEQNWQSGDWNGCKDEILRYTGILLTLYGLALAASIFYNRKMAEITQGTLKKLREKMFNSMQDFPVKYFDTHNHGDISYKIFLNGISPTCHSSSLLGLVLNKDCIPLLSYCQ